MAVDFTRCNRGRELVCGRGLAERQELSDEERRKEFNDPPRIDSRNTQQYWPLSPKNSRGCLSLPLSFAFPTMVTAKRYDPGEFMIAFIHAPDTEVSAPYHHATDLIERDPNDEYTSISNAQTQGLSKRRLKPRLNQ